jgi:hypothetical protein
MNGLLGAINPQTMPITYGLLSQQQAQPQQAAPTGFFDQVTQNIKQNMPLFSAGMAMLGAGASGQSFGQGAAGGLMAFSQSLALAEQEKQKQREQQMKQLMDAVKLDRELGLSGGFRGDSIEAQILNELASSYQEAGLDSVSARRAAIDQYNSSKSVTTTDVRGLPVTYNRNPLFGGGAPGMPQIRPQMPQQPVATPVSLPQAATGQQGAVDQIAALFDSGVVPPQGPDGMVALPEQLPPVPELAAAQGGMEAPQIAIPQFDPNNPNASQAAIEEAMRQNVRLQAGALGDERTRALEQEKMQKQAAIPGFVVKGDAIPNEDSVKKVRASALAYAQAVPVIDQMKQLMLTEGPALAATAPDDWIKVSTPLGDKYSQLRNAFLLEVKNLYELGALQAGDERVVTGLLPPISGLTTQAKDPKELAAQFDKVKELLDKRLEQAASIYGFERAGKGFKVLGFE